MEHGKAKKLVENIWEKYDKDGSGELEVQECMKFLRDMAYLSKDPTLYTQGDKIIQRLDRDHSGSISKEELIKQFIRN